MGFFTVTFLLFFSIFPIYRLFTVPLPFIHTWQTCPTVTVRYCWFVHLSGKLNYRFMSMVQRVFAKFISVIKFYHWRQNVHMPFNFHNIFAHHTHTQLPSFAHPEWGFSTYED